MINANASRLKIFLLLKLAVCLLILLLPAPSWAKEVKIAVLPWKVNSAENLDYIKAAMADMLSSRLGANPSVEIIRPDKVKAALAAQKDDLTDDTAAEIGRNLSADYVVYGSITVLGAAVSMDGRLVKTDGVVTPFYSKSTGMDSIIGLTDKLGSNILAFAFPPLTPKAVEAGPGPIEVKGAAAVKEESFLIKADTAGGASASWKSKAWSGIFKGFALADLNGDGVKEFFILTEHSVIIARKTTGEFETIKEIATPTGAENIAVTSIDSDKDGTTEVYVSMISNNRASGTIIEYRDGEYKVTAAGIDWLMRAVSVGKDGGVLIGQKFRAPDGMYGEIHKLARDGANIVDKGLLSGGLLPKGGDIYRFDPVDLTSAASGGITLIDDRNYIRLYTRHDNGKWEKTWTSAEYYGGTLNQAEFAGDTAEKEPITIESNFFHVYDKDGRPELIIKRNVPGGFGRYAKRAGSYVSGEIKALRWNGVTLEEVWKTRELNAYIADFLIDTLDKDGAKEIIMLVVEGTSGLSTTPKSYILSNKVPL